MGRLILGLDLCNFVSRLQLNQSHTHSRRAVKF